MSWLSNMFGGGDTTDYVAQQAEFDRQKKAKKAEQQAREEAAAKKAELATLRTNSANMARDEANQYFTSQGLDPTQYSSQIDSRINQLLGTIAEDDPNPAGYFTGLGENIYDAEQSGARSRALRSVDPVFGQDFDRSLIGDTFDDQYLNDIGTEQRGIADQMVENMRKRGVITDTGKAAALADLDRQGAGVRTTLNELGTGLLESGRESLRGVADRARTNASNLSLGQNFDVSGYQNEVDQKFNDFLSGFNDSLRSRIPTDLYDVGGLAAIAGAGQGAQNTAFDPNAAQGLFQEDQGDPLDPLDPNAKKKKQDAVF